MLLKTLKSTTRATCYTTFFSKITHMRGPPKKTELSSAGQALCCTGFPH